eukprot:TRINITY_DN21098_c0_g1_i2.p1 TRINITY_DN21098_c0_g1~~TRINITY_DN21098_c0_g1_i2.p1  ORF type:complete len:288 (-),score=70.72 TRINITY_DN21098_c0_g1_i2:129-992(-)
MGTIPDPGAHADHDRDEELPAKHARRTDAVERRSNFDFQRTLAFWGSIFFVEGSVLFTIGSVALYPDLNAELDAEFKKKAWVDYSFMIGAWCFTIGNYFIYYLVINAKHEDSLQDDEQDVISDPRWVSFPVCEAGHLGAASNLVGAVFYNINTMHGLWPKGGVRTTQEFDLWYVMTGVLGSAFFVGGAVCEGEHNGWRTLDLGEWNPGRSKQALPKIMSVLNLLGGMLFLTAYAVDYNYYADNHEHVQRWLVATPFTVGSVFFFVSSWIAMWMWNCLLYTSPSPRDS